ncbi:MAG: ferrous iron transport protein B [bacterium]|nr:ferrous iron transport protein B [bacterium]
MATVQKTKELTIALLGNPNTGKSTLFNALSGAWQRTGNYPGVTVEKKTGRCKVNGQSCVLVDLPGTYSLAPRSPDEMVAVDVLLGRRADSPSPDVILCIVDASNLARNMYLVSQALELEIPTVLALNMPDVAKDKGQSIDVEQLRKQLGIPIVEIQANRKVGLDALKTELAAAATKPAPKVESSFPQEFLDEVDQLQSHYADAGSQLPRFLVERLLLDTSGFLLADVAGGGPNLSAETASARERLAKAGMPVPAVEAMSRYQWIDKVLAGVVKRESQPKTKLGDRIDRVLTHRIWGTVIFIIIMIVLFQSVFLAAEPASMAIDWLTGLLSSLVAAYLNEGALRSLLIDGVIAGVGGVLVFLPQIFVLFLFVAILEDCGYMSRAAYLMDRLMSRVGLSGKSFIPLLSSFACAIPGIMAARVIENRRDRLVTILVAPLMSCSARLPVYTLLIAAFIPNLFIGYYLPLGEYSLPLGLGVRGITMFAMYSLGIVTAILVAFVLKRTILKGPTPPFVMELPAYKMPGIGIVLHRMFDRGWAFVQRAGTLILAASVVIWAMAYFPHNSNDIDPALFQQQQQLQAEIDQADPSADDTEESEREEQLAHIENEIAGQYLENSILGYMGHAIEPIVRPLGWDWKIGCAAIASFPAREVVISSLGVIYKLGDEVDEDSLGETLQNAKWDGTDKPVFNIPVALSIMVFFALCAQCVSTLAIMKRETNSWRWPAFTFVYMTVLAYIASFATYQIGMLLIN